MADSKISQLAQIDALSSVDLFAVVDDPAGTPSSKKATVAQVQDFIEASTNTFTATQTVYPATDAVSIVVKRNAVGQTSNILEAQTGDGVPLAAIDKAGNFSGGSFNKVTITAPASGSTLTIANGKTLTASNTLTLAGTDSSTMTFPATSGTVATLNTAQTFTAKQTIDLSGEQLALGGTNTGVMSLAGSTSGKVTIQAANAAGTYTLTLPTNDGDSGQALLTDGSGVLSWGAVGGTPGGSDTQVQFNDGGAFGGDAGLTFNKTTNALTIGAGSLNFTGGTSGTITIQPAAIAGTYTLTLPTDDGTSGQALITDGSGVLSWSTISASPGGSNTQLQFNSSGSFAGASGLTTNGTELTIASGTKTADAPVLNMSQTWNAGGVTFTGLKFNATDTASAAASLLMDLQVGGASKVAFGKNGSLALNGGPLNTGELNTPTNGGLRFGSAIHGVFPNGSNEIHLICAGTTAAFFRNSATFAVFNNSMGLSNASATADVILSRRAAANLRFGAADAAAPVAQTLSVQSGTAGASALTVSISGTALTIAGAITGTIAIGHAVTGTGVSAGTLITAGSGTSWTVNNSQTVGPITAYFNSVGRDLTITGSQGSGPSAGGSIIFQVAPAGAAATTAQNALATTAQFGPFQGKLYLGSASPTSSNYAIWGDGTNTWVNAPTSGGYVHFGSLDNWGVAVHPASLRISSTFTLGWTASNPGAALDLILARDAANTLALRNGTNAQAFNLYETYTDASNYSRMTVRSAGGDFEMLVNAAGTGGTGGKLVLGSRISNKGIDFYSQNILRWVIDGSGHFLTNADNTHDIGAATATRPRNLFLGSYAQLSEMTAPSAPAANGVRIYAVDNGSGKTQLMALFATGAAQQIAIEP